MGPLGLGRRQAQPPTSPHYPPSRTVKGLQTMPDPQAPPECQGNLGAYSEHHLNDQRCHRQERPRNHHRHHHHPDHLPKHYLHHGHYHCPSTYPNGQQSPGHKQHERMGWQHHSPGAPPHYPAYHQGTPPPTKNLIQPFDTKLRNNRATSTDYPQPTFSLCRRTSTGKNTCLEQQKL